MKVKTIRHQQFNENKSKHFKSFIAHNVNSLSMRPFCSEEEDEKGNNPECCNQSKEQSDV